MHKVAFLYTFFTAAPVIKSVKDTGCQPHSGQSTYQKSEKRKISHCKIQINDQNIYQRKQIISVKLTNQISNQSFPFSKLQ